MLREGGNDAAAAPVAAVEQEGVRCSDTSSVTRWRSGVGEGEEEEVVKVLQEIANEGEEEGGGMGSEPRLLIQVTPRALFVPSQVSRRAGRQMSEQADGWMVGGACVQAQVT